jgi:hypothetical protein
MRRLKLFCFVAVVLFASAGGAAATAQAEEKEEGGNPVFIPEKYPIEFTGGSTKEVTFETKTFLMVCKTGMTSKGEITSKRLGVIKYTFTECKEASGGVAKCNTAGAAAGTVIINAEFHLVAFKVNAELTAGIMILLPETSIKCGTFTDTYKGAVIGRIPVTQVNKLVKSFEALYEETKGVQALKECELVKAICEKEGKKLKFLLEGNLNNVGFAETGLEMLENTFKPTVEVEVKT